MNRVALESFLLKPGFQAVFLFRLSFFFHQKGLIYFPWLIMRINQFFTGAEIDFNTQIGEGMLLPHANGVTIARGAKIGKRFTIFQNATVGHQGFHKIEDYPVIGDNVIVYAGGRVLGGIKVGDNVDIGSNAVVLKDLPSNSVAVGIPAQIKSKKVKNG